MSRVTMILMMLVMVLAGGMNGQVIHPLGTADARTTDHYMGTMMPQVYNSSMYFFWKNGTTTTFYRATGSSLAAVRTYAGESSLLTVCNGLMYFRGDDGPENSEPWRSDGSVSGTYMLGNLNTGGRKTNAESSNPSGFSEFGNKVLFSIGYFPVKGAKIDLTKTVKQMYITDGTVAGTSKVVDFKGDQYYDLGNGIALFYASTDSEGNELWCTDGKRKGTALIMDIYPGANSSIANPDRALFAPEVNALFDTRHPVVIGGKMYFRANDGSHGDELWVSDGTTAGTKLLADINPEGPSYPSFLTVLDGILYFTADDGTNGFELWSHNPVSNTTTMAANINATSGSVPCWLTPMNGRLYFSANDGIDDRELWVFDPASTLSHRVFDINPDGSSFPGYRSYYGDPDKYDNDRGRIAFTVFNDELYFAAAKDGSTFTLWKSDGATASEILCPGYAGLLSPRRLTALPEAGGPGYLYFVAYDGGTTGNEWYIYDPDVTSSPKHEMSSVSPDLVVLENYPNPANPSTIIHYVLPQEGDVRLELFNSCGRLIKRLAQGKQHAGSYRVVVEMADLPGGSYFLRLQSGMNSVVRPMTLLH